MIIEAFPRSPALSPNLRNRLKLILIASRVPIAPALLILGDEIAHMATLMSMDRRGCVFWFTSSLLSRAGEDH